MWKSPFPYLVFHPLPRANPPANLPPIPVQISPFPTISPLSSKIPWKSLPFLHHFPTAFSPLSPQLSHHFCQSLTFILFINLLLDRLNLLP